MDLFKEIIKSAGIPTEQAELNAAFKQISIEERVIFNNDSKYSPFWRLITAIVTKPVLWLLGLLTNDILPNLFLKTSTGRWLDLYAWSVGITRKPATRAAGELTLIRYDNIGVLSVPAGTIIQTNTINGKLYRLSTIRDVEFMHGEAALVVQVEAEEGGTAYNIGGSAYKVLVDTQLAGKIDKILSDNWLLVPGSNEESDEELRLRARNQFTAINRWHIDSTYKAMIAQFPGISVDDIYLEHNAPRGAGTANAWILFDADAPADDYLKQINDYINKDGNHGFGDDLQCFTMRTYPVDISLDYWLLPNTDDDRKTAIKSQIEVFIRTAFREMKTDDYSPSNQPTLTFPNRRFSWSKLSKELHRQIPELASFKFQNNDDLLNGMNVPAIRNLSVSPK